MALIECPECGQEISDKAKKCIHCGYELQAEKNKKRFFLIIGTVILFAIIFLGMKLFGNRNINVEYFDNNKWDTSYDNIKKKYGDDISESYLLDGALAMYKENFNGIEGIYTMIQFEFDKDGGLDTVLLMVSNSESNMSDSEVYDLVIDGLNESYGDAKEVDYGLSWETDNSIIEAKQYPGSADYTMIIYNKRGK